MPYLHHMIRVLRFEESVYREVITRNKLSLWYTALNVSMLGLLYGGSNVLFADTILASHGIYEPVVPQVKITLLLMGVSITFLVHGAAALFAWVFCRGIGGSTLFMPVYLAIGMAAVAFWPMAPILSAVLSKSGGQAAFGLLFVTLAYGFIVLFHAVKSASGLALPRMVIVSVILVIYIISFMYLWVG